MLFGVRVVPIGAKHGRQYSAAGNERLQLRSFVVWYQISDLDGPALGAYISGSDFSALVAYLSPVFQTSQSSNRDDLSERNGRMISNVVGKLRILAHRMTVLWHRIASKLKYSRRVIFTARKQGAAPYPVLVFRLFSHHMRHKFSLIEIDQLGLLAKEINHDWFNLNLSKEALHIYQGRMNPKFYRVLTADKNVFYNYCIGAKLRVPRYHGKLSIPRGVAAETMKELLRSRLMYILRNVTTADIILKPALGAYGRGVISMSWNDGVPVDFSDGLRSMNDVLEAIINSGAGSYVVQERIYSHQELTRLSGTKNLQTIRVGTYVTKRGEVKIICCQMKIIGGDRLVDNFSDGRGGNYVGDIPGGCGKLSEVFCVSEGGSGIVVLDKHPRTGVAFRDFSIPYWQEVCELARSAAACFLPLRTIGWDIAITGDGPVLIEGNETWDPTYEGVVGREFLDAVKVDA